MSLLTRQQKKDKNFMKLYEKFIEEGMKPQKAIRKAKLQLEK